MGAVSLEEVRQTLARLLDRLSGENGGTWLERIDDVLARHASSWPPPMSVLMLHSVTVQIERGFNTADDFRQFFTEYVFGQSIVVTDEAYALFSMGDFSSSFGNEAAAVKLICIPVDWFRLEDGTEPQTMCDTILGSSRGLGLSLASPEAVTHYCRKITPKRGHLQLMGMKPVADNRGRKRVLAIEETLRGTILHAVPVDLPQWHEHRNLEYLFGFTP